MDDSEPDLDSDEKRVTISVDPSKFLQSLSILSEVKSARDAIILLLTSISIEHAKPSQGTASTRKRPSNETSTDKDSETKKARKIAGKARKNIAKELKGIKSKKDKENKKGRRARRGSEEKNDKNLKCYNCDKTFNNLSNLKRHINNLHLSKCAEVYENEKPKYSCGLCDSILCSRGNLNRHFRLSHSIELSKSERKSKLKDVKTNAEYKDHKPEEASVPCVRDLFMFVCKDCEVATLKIDCAVEHAQLHQFSTYKPIPQICEICKFTFEEQYFAEHLSIHINSNQLILRYSPSNMLNNDWSNIFEGIDNTLINKIKSSSVYEHTRKVKMNADESDDPSGKPLYQCDMCKLHFHPDEIEDHCNKERACDRNQIKNHCCGECDRFFFTSEALSQHEKEEDGNVRFRTVIFNYERDLPINRALRKLQGNSQLLEEISQREMASCSTDEPKILKQQNIGNTKKNVILENHPVNVEQFCHECGHFISFSDIKAHEAIHNNNAGVQDECDQSMVDEGPQEQNYSINDNEEGNILHGNPDGGKTIDENIMNQDNINCIDSLHSSAMLEETNVEKDEEEEIDKVSSKISIASAITRKRIEFDDDDDSFRAFERQDLQYFVDNESSKQSSVKNYVIETSDESECEDDEDSNSRLPTQGASSYLNEAVENDESIDKSKIKLIVDVEAIVNNLSNETNDDIDLLHESDNEERETKSNIVSNVILPTNLNDGAKDDENDEERRKIELQLLIEEEQRIKEITSV